MNNKQLKLHDHLNKRQHKLLIHGFLMAIQEYVISFRLIGTAAYVLKTSGINKEDLLRCQLESGWQNETMLPVIEKAFAKEEPIKKTTMNRNMVYTLDQLVEGDRFYRPTEKKKTVMAVHEVTSSPSGAVQSVNICLSQYYPTGFDNKLIKKPKEYQVVFLRHEIDVA